MEQEQDPNLQKPEDGVMSEQPQDVAAGGEKEHMSKNAIILIVLVVIVLVLVLMYVWGSRTSTPTDEIVVDEPTMTFDEFVAQNQPPLEEAANDVNAVLGTLQTQTFMADIDELETELSAALTQ